MSEKPKNIFEFYRRIFTKRPYLVLGTGLLYSLFSIAFFFRDDIIKWRSVNAETPLRIAEMEKRMAQQDAIIEALTKRSNSASFFRNLDFQEQWKTDQNRQNILRLLEYAHFAIEKADYSRAESLYEEASHIQETMSVPYNRSRLYYMVGDLQSAELQLRRVIELDSSDGYRDLRLYLAIVLYQTGKEKEGEEYFRKYLKYKE